MNWRELLFGKPPQEPPKAQSSNYRTYRSTGMPSHKYGSAKYGPVQFGSYVQTDPAVIRERARVVYRESTIAHGIVTRLVDTVVNTGLTWESSPTWDHIPTAPTDESQRYTITREIEQLWRAWVQSSESDITGRLSFGQLQRLAYRTELVDGEVVAILRYLNSPDRISPVAIQLINADQICTPWGPEQKQIEDRGGKIEDGVEFDSTGREVAVWVQQDLGKKHERIPYTGPRSGRRFVVRSGNFEAVGQSRGLPELDAVVYELSRLTEYDIAELEGMVASSALLAAIEIDKDAAVSGKKPGVRPNVPVSETDTKRDGDTAYGINTQDVGKFAIVMNNLEPGQTMKLFQNNRPASNFDAFVKSFVTRIAGGLGMPFSVAMQIFQSSYSASRAEILFYWLNVNRRRDDFINGFLKPIYEAVFTEWVRAGELSATGYLADKKIRRAWLGGTWNGVSMPQVDPMKEVNAVEKRIELGHTTGEREAKVHNGSDYRENIERLRTENQLRAEVNAPLNPAPIATDPDTDDDSGNDNDDEAVEVGRAAND